MDIICENNVKLKECSHCHEHKELKFFYQNICEYKDKIYTNYRPECINCTSQKTKERNIRLKRQRIEKRLKNGYEHNGDNIIKIEQDNILFHKCKKCNKLKEKNEFTIKNTKYSGICLKCNAISSKIYRDKHIDQIRARDRKRDLKRRKKYSIHEKILRTIRRSILKNLHKSNIKKNIKTIQLLGCSTEQFKKYIESTWSSGMTWANHGSWKVGTPMKWHIDHIKPCAKFDLSKEEEQNKCFNWKNQMALWANSNLEKSDNIITDYQI